MKKDVSVQKHPFFVKTPPTDEDIKERSDETSMLKQSTQQTDENNAEHVSSIRPSGK
jgi:hypothetical protein